VATVCRLSAKDRVKGKLARKYAGESVTETFDIFLDSPTRNIVEVAQLARAANPTQFPLRGQGWPANPFYGLFADTFDLEPQSELNKIWKCTVTYTPLEPGEPNTEGNNENPLLWPSVPGLEWLEEEEAIEEAYNVEAIGSASQKGERPALTLGQVCNSALQEFEEGLFRTKRVPVITMTKNVATLGEIYKLQTDFEDTTNSDTLVAGNITPRQLEYLCVEHQSEQTANGIKYFSRTVKILLRKSTDRKLNNVGWHYWKTENGVKKLKRVTVEDEETDLPVPASEPSFLTHAGVRAFDTTSVTFRYLTPKTYASLLT
jgi:hypothetical protein